MYISDLYVFASVWRRSTKMKLLWFIAVCLFLFGYADAMDFGMVKFKTGPEVMKIIQAQLTWDYSILTLN